MGVAHGGQVVVSLATEELARDDGIEMVDLGEHRLKDLGQPERIYQVLHAGLEREFPPLRSLDRFTTNLPTQHTSFIGRDAELAALVEALDDARLVTLTGVGGVGKTRLALQLAAEMMPAFSDGVWLVELAPVGDPSAVPDAVATTLGLAPRPGVTLTSTIADALAGRHALLVLDNCEHLLDAAAELVAAILARPGPLKVVATSREGLRVADEHLWPVPSLRGRDGSGDDALALFVDRARAVDPGFESSGAGVIEAIDEVCRRLDGIPLAIELAAARTIAVSVPELRDRLDDRFRLLSGSRRGLERHQTLRHAVQWSYDLLDDDERSVLQGCSVFAGGHDLDAATAVAGADRHLDEYAVLDVLDALVRKSLVTADRSGGRTRYAMLETIRQYAHERLEDSGRLITTRLAHAHYFARRADEVLLWWDDERQADAYRWMEAELANLRVAFRTAVDADDLDAAASVATAAGPLCSFLAIYEPAVWADELVDAARAADHPRLQALCVAACHASGYGVVVDSTLDVRVETAIALAGDARYDPLPFGLAVGAVSDPMLRRGAIDVWIEFCQGEIGRLSTPPVFAQSLLVIALTQGGRGDEAATLSGDVVAAAEHHPNATALAVALMARGIAHFDRDPAVAMVAMHRAMELGRREHTGARTMTMHAAAFLAQFEADFGDERTALDLAERAILDYHAVGGLGLTEMPMLTVAQLLRARALDEPAAELTGYARQAEQSVLPTREVLRVQLEESLGTETYERCMQAGERMEPAEAVRFALAQIDQLRGLS
jgi:predicted ATPase